MITNFIKDHWFITTLIIGFIIFHYSKRNEVEYEDEDD